MSFQADALAFEPDRISAAFDNRFPHDSSTAADDRLSIRLTPRHGVGVRDVGVRHALYGAPGAPVVVVQGGISATRHASSASPDASQGWWDALVGPLRAVDTTRFRVLSIDWLELADLGTADAIGSEDQADAIAAVLDALGIGRVHAFVGASYGAMVGIAFAARHPRRLQRLVAVAGAHRAHPLSVALRNIQRDVVRLGERLGDPDAGLALARRLAMTTYRGEREFAERCADAPIFEDGRFRFAEEAWLNAAGAKFVSRFSTARFLSLSESIDLHDVAPEDVRVPTTLVGITTDRVVPLSDLCDLQRRCGAATTLHVIDSRYGHDGFLKEDAQIGPLLQEALDADTRHATGA